MMGEGAYSDLYPADLQNFKSPGELDGKNGAPLILHNGKGSILDSTYVMNGLGFPQSFLVRMELDAKYPTLPKASDDKCVAVITFDGSKIVDSDKIFRVSLNKRSPIVFQRTSLVPISLEWLKANPTFNEHNYWRIDLNINARDPTNGGTTSASHWFPKGFTEYSDGVAYMFDNTVTHDCYSFAPCWGLRIMTRDGCASIAVEGNALDKSDAVVQEVNDYVSNLLPKQEAKVVLRSSDSSAYTWSMHKLECRN